MKSELGQRGMFHFSAGPSHFFLSFPGSCLRRSRRSVARPALAQRAWRPTGGGDEGNGACLCWWAEREAVTRISRPNDLTHTTIRGVDASFLRRLIFPCVLIRADALLATFVLATLSSAWRGTAWSLTKPSRTPCQVLLGGLSNGLGWPCLFVRFSLVSPPLGGCLV